MCQLLQKFRLCANLESSCSSALCDRGNGHYADHEFDFDDLVLSACSNSKAVGKMGKPTALPSSPIRTVFLSGNRAHLRSRLCSHASCATSRAACAAMGYELADVCRSSSTKIFCFGVWGQFAAGTLRALGSDENGLPPVLLIVRPMLRHGPARERCRPNGRTTKPSREEVRPATVAASTPAAPPRIVGHCEELPTRRAILALDGNISNFALGPFQYGE